MWRALLLACAGCAAAVDVLRLPVAYEQDHAITIDNSVEYVLEFSPSEEQALWATRVRLGAAGGAGAADAARPVLLTARQAAGAQTWQLPYRSQSGSQLLFQLQRTLCFDVTAKGAGAWSLHVSSASNASTQVTVRADPARDWLLPFDLTTTVRATQTAAAVYFYRWSEGQNRVRLIVASDDDVCATVAVLNNTCPVSETMEAISRGGLRMTVQRSGGAQLARSQFPEGFWVVTVVAETDEECAGPAQEQRDWLWEAAAAPPAPPPARPARPPHKELSLTLRAALTRGQYLVASSVTLAVFLGFYAVFLGLVFVQRYEPVKRLVGPKAVLAAPAATGGETVEDSAAHGRRRRGSDATFDSVDDDSDSDEESTGRGPAHHASDGTVPPQVTISDPVRAIGHETNGVAAADGAGAAGGAGEAGGAPFGLPAQLTVAALARLGARTLRVRSDRYLHTLYIVAVFYALPVLQFVAAFQLVLNVSGSLDLCYYNFLCAHPAGVLSDFNHVFSNLGYLLLGALFMLQLRRRRRRRERRPRHEEYGIPAHYGLLQSLGASMMMVALLSASYHVCPNRLNFQFDTAFMYVLAVLAMVKMYQARHPDINARAHATFGVLAALIALVVWGVLGGGPLFWGMFTVLHIFTFLLLSLQIYYVGQFKLESAALAEAARGLRSPSRPLYVPRLVMLLIANTVNWAFALYGLFTQAADFAGHLLQVLLCNTLLYMVFYLSMKLLHGERLRWYSWAFLAGAAAAWAPALYLFVSGSSDWSATPALSRHRNHECRVLQFYDSHDLWHILSAVALYLSFNAMLTWDDGLSAIKRTDIAVF